MKQIIYLLVLGVAFLLSSCDQKEKAQGSQPHYSDAQSASAKVFVLGIHPLYNPQRLAEVFTPLADYLTRQLPSYHFIIEASKDYADYNQKLREGQFDFALPNPYQTLLAADHGYTIIAKVAPDDEFMGIILTPKTSALSDTASLKGKAISFPAPSAVAATMLPQWFLFSRGLKPHRDYEVQYVVSQESSILAVANGITQAGATWPPPWKQFQQDHPELAAKLVVTWKTQTLPNNGFVARNDIPDSIKQQVVHLLTQLGSHEEGKRILSAMKFDGFEPADRDSYQSLVTFIDQFETNIRKTEDK